MTYLDIANAAHIAIPFGICQADEIALTNLVDFLRSYDAGYYLNPARLRMDAKIAATLANSTLIRLDLDEGRLDAITAAIDAAVDLADLMFDNSGADYTTPVIDHFNN
jgi:hypothetical protein